MCFTGSRVLRVLRLAVALAAFGTPATLVAGPGKSPGPIDITNVREPFGLGSAPMHEGGLVEKWTEVWRQWNDEKRGLETCRDNRAQCTDPAAVAFLAIVDNARTLNGRAQIGVVNRAINLAIKPADDLAAYGLIDVWSPPLSTLARRSGDCEDYAIAKFVALLEAGVPPADLRLLIVRDVVLGEDHAIVAARHEDRWLLLDNRRLALLEDTQLTGYLPRFMLDAEGARRYLDMSPPAIEQSSTPVSTVEPNGPGD